MCLSGSTSACTYAPHVHAHCVLQEGLDMSKLEGLSQAIGAIGLLPLHILVDQNYWAGSY